VKNRLWILAGLLVALGTWYVFSFTEWVNPEPIRIQTQIRELPKDRTGRVARAPRPEKSGGANQVKIRPNEGSQPGEPPKPGEPRTVEATRIEPAPKVGRGGGRSDGGLAGSGGDFEGMAPVVFALDGDYRLTSIRVIEVEAAATNKFPRIVWQVDSSSNSVPSKAIIYGRVPRGMKLKDERDPPKRLEAGVNYRLELKAGRFAGSTVFQAKEQTPVEPAE
jgi:hypothetical protein